MEKMGSFVKENIHTRCMVFFKMFSLPGETGPSGAPGLSGNYPPISMSYDGKCVPCPFGPKGPSGPKGSPGQPVTCILS